MDWRVRAVIAYAGENLHRRATHEELARHVGLSSSRLRHLFKAETKSPLSQYLASLRIEKAQALLETSSLSVKEISAMVGYAHASHFARDFKKRMGAPPARYRARFHGGEPPGES